MPDMRGFTLVELVLVIVIIGIISAVVGPRFFDRQVFNERLFFEESLAAVRYGQKIALASGCLTQVSLDTNGYHLRQAMNCTSGAYSLEVQSPDGDATFAAAAPTDVTLVAANFPVVFDSLGRPSSAASATIGTLNGGHSFSVTADTGLVQ
ncbi:MULTISPECIES: prepilin-type N-terminal cleavage/methylation domain-containing protein [unclassified Pseudomonas]|uniref:prepilin-type N-terminal cleavage/methylation domain-containing protein n=1 Tax=unclassified Pseudomonas TaxID=196821 RepID=UPI002AC94B5E|nr:MULTISPECIES: prepilin-type N-terminal cleavage/methylation domain-containing protein [unclassified Pseudomonas]MEB0039929.1 prepilin-type N-terminal cleavage/methylation domain-containing protein [Pseudomonas sp. MH10]MEB0123917.1 prepilin-type N-terminal cleavage/methylation domain-containing protein [Pseudomonas sp. CCI1.2]WPX66121.1 prepilin-type N-terminal cleavage/methylation domain-containing protein [Pseudomonas sp. MH10]